MAYPVVKNLLANYVATLRFVFRHNVFGELHRNAHAAAVAAEAAGRQGRFWEAHDLFFEHPRILETGGIEGLVALLGLDMKRFRRDVHAPEVARHIRDMEIGGLRSGVIGTPTFFVNGQRFFDRPDLATLSAAVGKALSEGTAGTSMPGGGQRPAGKDFRS
jgi:protein-disulfide isomerase